MVFARRDHGSSSKDNNHLSSSAQLAGTVIIVVIGTGLTTSAIQSNRQQVKDLFLVP
jgi:hypothetical protein